MKIYAVMAWWCEESGEYWRRYWGIEETGYWRRMKDWHDWFWLRLSLTRELSDIETRNSHPSHHHSLILHIIILSCCESSSPDYMRGSICTMQWLERVSCKTEQLLVDTRTRQGQIDAVPTFTITEIFKSLSALERFSLFSMFLDNFRNFSKRTIE